MVVKCNSFGINGMDGYRVEIEASAETGLPSFDMVGLPDTAVRESRDRVKAPLKTAVSNSLGSPHIELSACRHKKGRSYLRFADYGDAA